MFKIWRPKNLTEALLPVLIFNWVFGHRLIQYPVNNFEFIQTVLYSIILHIIYIVSLSYALWYFITAPWFSNGDKIYLIVIFINIFIFIANDVISWFYKKVSSDFIIKILIKKPCVQYNNIQNIPYNNLI